jgi:hypothetical protein
MSKSKKKGLLAAMCHLIADLTRDTVDVGVTVAGPCLAMMVLVAELPFPAVLCRIASVSRRCATVVLARAIFPCIAFIVSDTVALPCGALLGDLVAALPALAVLIVDAESDLSLAVVGLEVAGLPCLAVPIQLASPREDVTSLADYVAFLPGVAVKVSQAVAWRRAALVGGGIAVLEGRVALGIAVAIAWACPAAPCAVAYLPGVAVGVGPALAFLVDAKMGVGHVAGLEVVIAVGLGLAVTWKRRACAARHVAVLPFLAIGVLGACGRPSTAPCQYY